MKRLWTRSYAMPRPRGLRPGISGVEGGRPGSELRQTPAATTFVLLLGFAVGRRGRLLFETPWVAVLDTSPDDLIDVAVDAKRLGLLDLKQSGSMIDVSFPALFTDKERELIHGAHRQVWLNATRDISRCPGRRTWRGRSEPYSSCTTRPTSAGCGRARICSPWRRPRQTTVGSSAT